MLEGFIQFFVRVALLLFSFLSLHWEHLSARQASLLKMPPALGADTTPYASKGFDVEPQFRAMLHAEGIPEAIRLRLAELKFDTISKFSLLGKDLAAFETKIETLLGATLGADAVKVQNTALLAVVWDGCRRVKEFKLTQRMRLQEDPHKIPEIHSSDFADMRERFLTAHPDVLLTDDNEPHKKFIEKVDRDLQVHGTAQYYELTECRVRKDKIVPKNNYSKTLDGLLKTVEVNEDATLDGEEDALNRITAFLIMCAYLNINSYRSRTYTEGCTDGCGMSYLALLNEKRREFSGTAEQRFFFVVTADKKIRKRVAKLLQDKRAKYPTYASAMSHVLQNESELWKDARDEARLHRPGSKRPRSRTPEKTPAPTGTASEAETKLAKIKEARKAKAKKKLEKKKAKIAAAKTNGGGGGGGGAGSGGGGGGAAPSGGGAGKKTKDGRQMASPAMFKKVNELCKGKKVCPFYNLPCGCKFDSDCAKEHICAQCGQNHPYCSNH